MEKEVHDAELKSTVGSKKNSVVLFLPENICVFTLKGKFCVLEVQPS